MASKPPDELLDQLHHLRQQKLAASLPVGLQLIVHLRGGLEDDRLRTAFPDQFFQINGLDLLHIHNRLAVEGRDQLRNGGRLAGVDFQRLEAVPIQHRRG